MAKLGDIDNETGRIFWSKDHGWITPKAFKSYMASKKRAAIKFRKNNPNYAKRENNKNWDKQAAQRKEYYQKNKEIIKLRAKKWRKNNPEKSRAIQRKRQKKAYHANPVYAARMKLSNRINCAIRRKGMTSYKSTIELVGCTARELMALLEAQFKPGMNWSNWSPRGWHVDHKIPLASAKTIEELEKLCHYTNLQPLWWHENFDKSDKIIQHDGNRTPQDNEPSLA